MEQEQVQEETPEQWFEGIMQTAMYYALDYPSMGDVAQARDIETFISIELKDQYIVEDVSYAQGALEALKQ